MSTIETRAHKHTGPTRDALESLDRPNCLGTDGQGGTHHHSPYDRRVVVVSEAGDIEHVEELGTREIGEWIAYVRDERGWASLNYRESFAEIVVEAFDE